jgi:hypothetical protein
MSKFQISPSDQEKKQNIFQVTGSEFRIVSYCSIFLINNLLFCNIFFLLVGVRDVLLFTGNTILVRGPLPQVDKTASLGTERSVFIPVPGCIFFTYRAPDHFLLHRVLFPTLCFRHLTHLSTYAMGNSIHPCTYGIGAARYTARMEALSRMAEPELSMISIFSTEPS